MIRWSQGRHLVPVPSILEEEELDLLRNLIALSNTRIDVKTGDGSSLPGWATGTNPIRAQAW